MTDHVGEKILFSDWPGFRFQRSEVVGDTCHESVRRKHVHRTAMVEVETFLESVEQRLRDKRRRGSVGYIELINEVDNRFSETLIDQHRDVIISIVDDAIAGAGIFCWYAGRFMVLLDQASVAATRAIFAAISRAIAERTWIFEDSDVHSTPVVGYSDLILTNSARELWSMAEAALDRAKDSLEIQPVRYGRRLSRNETAMSRLTLVKLTRLIPKWLVLAFQFLASLLIGLGAPFVFYAACDALGFDISGPVYIGVVVVLVITALTIWIEGFLALKSTTPPAQPGSPYPLATIIIPAYLPNEASTIIETLHAFLKLDYANTVQVIVAYNTPVPHMPVEDEMASLAADRALGGRFIIEPIRVEGSTSKAQNVNAVVGRVRGRFVGIFDADHHPQADSLERAWRWLSNGWDIVQGRCSIRNGHESWLARMIAVEFEQIYAVSHPGRARFHGFGIFGGSNGFWRTPVLHETRMRHSMLTEDIDSSIRAVVAGYRIAGDRDLISEELAPTTMKQLLNQRLRWAQGWFQVSFRRLLPALLSPRVTVRQKLGLLHLLVWRELFPWYSIQVVPIMAYWIMVYGWHYIQWTIPIFLATTAFTVSTGPGQIIIAYMLARKPVKRKLGWFVEYLFVSTFFFSPFKDALSRIAHVKEAMGERAWKVTPRVAPPARRIGLRLAGTSAAALLLTCVTVGTGFAQTPSSLTSRSPREIIATLLGGEAATINAARTAAHEGRNSEAASLFAKAIEAVPSRRDELLREYADSLTYSGRSAQAVPLYKEVLASGRVEDDRWKVAAQLALALTWSGQNRAAAAVYDRVSAHDPADVDVALRRARVLVSVGRIDEALAALDRLPVAAWSSGPRASLGQQTLVEIAQVKARTGDTAGAKRMLARADQHSGGPGQPPARALTILTGAPPTRIVATMNEPRTPRDYRAAIARLAPGSAEFWKAQRGLAVSLAAADAKAEALDALAVYLRHAPSDVDALLTRARLLSDLQEHRKALDAYQAVYELNAQNGAARAGMRNETVALARAAARNDKNAESESLFAAAIKIDPAHRRDLLREYADQLSFSGNAVDAIPLYTEWLAGADQRAVERKQAMIGLANAYAWSGQQKEAAAAYAQVQSAFPEDRAIRWTTLVFNARNAAKNDRNAEAEKLFAEAVALDPDRSAEILREYADQLTFTHQADRAIPLYIRYLAAPTLREPDRLRAELGLARADEWTERLEDAKKIYAGLSMRHPNLPEYRWHLLVVSGREAARADRNGESAEYFAQAIALDPERSRSILPEYADQLTFTQRPENAIGFYRASLAQKTISDADRLSIRKSLARALEWAGRPAEAAEVDRELVAQRPGDASLQWSNLVLSARAAARADNNAQAAALLAKAIELLPAKRPEILKEYADKLTYSGKPKLAIPLYKQLLAEDRELGSLPIQRSAQDRSPAGMRDTRLSLALALAWNKQRTEAMHEYQRLLDANPDDVKAGVGVAQMLSWSGRQSDALNTYQRLLANHPDNGDLLRGIAQAQDWEGHHREAQATLQDLLRRHPEDAEARRLLAQSLAWSGRPDKAIAEVRRALELQNRSRIGPDTAAASVRQASASSARSTERGGSGVTLVARDDGQPAR